MGDGAPRDKSETGEHRTALSFAHPDRDVKTTKAGFVVLLVDDDHAAITLTAVTLRRLGCRTFLAGNGDKALETLEHQPSVNVIITDIDMPLMNGLELLCRIKDSARHKLIPVILYSGHDDPETIQKAADEGCALYLVKPVEPDFLFEQIGTVVRLGDEAASA